MLRLTEREMTSASAAGALAFAPYLGSGSLLMPILLHIIVDLQGVQLSYRAFGSEATIAPESP